MNSPFIAFGVNTVKNIIKSSLFTLKKVILQEENRDNKELISSLREKNVSYEILKKNDFVRYKVDKKCQGVVAFIKEYRYLSLRSLLSLQPKRKYPIVVILDSIEDPQNFGAILRNLAAFEIDGVIISKKNQVPVNGTVIKVSVGGVSHVPVCQVESLDDSVNELKKKNFKILSTVCEEKSSNYNQFDFNLDSPIGLIFGNEHQGIKKSLIKKSDHLLYIPIKKEIGSLNVSVSCGIFCAKIVSQLEQEKLLKV